MKSFEFSWKSEKGSVSFSDWGELGQVPVTKEFFGIMQVSEENILIKIVFGHKDFEFLGFLFFEFHGCIKDGQAEVSWFFFAELKLDQAHLHKEISQSNNDFVDAIFFTLDLEESESGFFIETKFQSHQNFTFHNQELIASIGSIRYFNKSFEPGSGDFLVFGSNVKTCSAQDLIFAFDDVSLVAVFVNQKDGHVESLQFEAESAWNFDKPAHKDFSHVDVNVGLPLDVVLWNDWVGFVGFDIGDDVLSVGSDWRIEVFGVGERILNLNFAGQILNFGNLAALHSSRTPPQGKDSVGAFMDFMFPALGLGVYSVLVRIHALVLTF